ncbi:hypothetical protein BGX34_006816, partial [Mortierella sp. NVP85]
MELAKVQDAYDVYSEYLECLEQVLDNFLFYRMLWGIFSAFGQRSVQPRLFGLIQDCDELVTFREDDNSATAMQFIIRLEDEERFAIQMRNALEQALMGENPS